MKLLREPLLHFVVIAGLVLAVLQVCRFAESLSDTFIELEINPFLVRAGLPPVGVPFVKSREIEALYSFGAAGRERG